MCLSRVWSQIWLTGIYAQIHFSLCPTSLQLQSLHLISNCQKLWERLLKYGEIPLLGFWLIAVMCYVCISGECAAIISTETTQLKHWPLLSVYCIMGVTGRLSPILRSPLVFPTSYDSFTSAGLRLGSFLTSWTAAALRLSRNLPFPSLSLPLSPLWPLGLYLKHFLSFPHTQARNYIKPLSDGVKEDSWAYFKGKVLISHNSFLCARRRGSPYFFFKQPSVGEG